MIHSPIMRSPLKSSGQSWSSYWTQQLSRNSDIVLVAGYLNTPTTGFGSGNASRAYLNKNNATRIRQDGTITKISLYINASLANLTAIYVYVWRKDGATYDRIGISQNILASCSIATLNEITLNTPISVLTGDYIGVGDTTSSSNSDVYGVKNTSTANSIRYVSEAGIPSGNDYAWDGGSASTYIIILKAHAQAPLVSLIGDSIIAGHPTNYSLIEDSLTEDATCRLETLLKAINAKYVCQNMGIGSQVSAQIQARFATDVVALKPKIVVINGGVNDIAGGSVSKATFLSNYTSMLDACLTNDIMPVVCKILPWTNGTNEQMQTRDEWMTDLQALVNSATYNGAVWVDFDTAMGKNRAGGDPGNLWDLQTTPDYDNDGVHPTALGYAKMAEVIDAAIIAKGYVLN